MKIVKRILLLVAVTAAMPCFAGVYKCQVKGKWVYQDAPCDPVQLEAGKINVPTNQMTYSMPKPPPVQERTVVVVPNAPAGANSMSGSVDEASSNIVIGMSAENARKRFGEPRKINRTTSAGGVREQWVYDNGQYVYVDNGRVTAIQEAETRRR